MSKSEVALLQDTGVVDILLVIFSVLPVDSVVKTSHDFFNLMASPLLRVGERGDLSNVYFHVFQRE